MKIGQPVDKTAQASGSAAASTPAAAAASTPVAGTAIPAQADPSLKVQLSSTASTLLTGNSTPEFDAAKVARMSAAIQNGTFQVNHGAIADKLISNAKEVLGKVQS